MSFESFEIFTPIIISHLIALCYCLVAQKDARPLPVYLLL